ncbi:MAG: hypothetical protein FD180_1741 [Planctomycetota bacterium]|nr:MAG: hypothetical protein FD180_1741 [Planctomycetota bacterium]
MDGISCDRCGTALLVGANVRYVVAIDVRAAYDVMEVSRSELEADHREEMRALLKKLEGLGAEEAQRQVHCAFRFDLCPACQRNYVNAPLASAPTAPRRLEDVERAAIQAAWAASGREPARAAEILGVKKQGLARRMKRLGIKK